jgi:hypothetical protein
MICLHKCTLSVNQNRTLARGLMVKAVAVKALLDLMVERFYNAHEMEALSGRTGIRLRNTYTGC